MADAENNDVIYYHSQFRHGVDEKRRVQVPSKWRPSRPETELTLFLWSNAGVKDACLLVLPPSEMEALAQKLRAMPRSDARAVALRRQLGSQSASVTLDKVGRICLPEAMAKAVKIEKEALLVGLVDCFEIWDPERYEKVNAADGALLQEALKLI